VPLQELKFPGNQVGFRITSKTSQKIDSRHSKQKDPKLNSNRHSNQNNTPLQDSKFPENQVGFRITSKTSQKNPKTKPKNIQNSQHVSVV